MKIIITESKLDSIILNYINDMFPIENIHFTEHMDNDGNPNDSLLTFYIGDDEVVFRLYNKSYFDNIVGADEVSKSVCPILRFKDNNVDSKMTGMFGDKWKPVFKKWFKEHFGIRIKTII